MKKTYSLEDLCCPNCAAKVEKEVAKLEGVNGAKLTFLTQKLVLDVADGMEEAVEKAAIALITKLEPDVTVVAK